MEEAITMEKPAVEKPMEAAAHAHKHAAEKHLPEAKIKRKKEKVLMINAKKKMSVARAIIRKGTGVIRVNGLMLENFANQKYLQLMMQEPLILAGAEAKESNITIRVKGSGTISQVACVRSAIAKALVAFNKDDKLRHIYAKYDRNLLVDDPRRVESKKPLGTKARAKKQKSKR